MSPRRSTRIRSRSCAAYSENEAVPLEISAPKVVPKLTTDKKTPLTELKITGNVNTYRPANPPMKKVDETAKMSNIPVIMRRRSALITFRKPTN